MQNRGEVIASAMIIFWSRYFYHQGASSQKYPKIPASYLIQWEQLKKLKKEIAIHIILGYRKRREINNKNHPWAGLTLFKKGFLDTQKNM